MMEPSKMIDNLAAEMGSTLFSDLVDFDMEMSESDYTYKILMGRRFFVLHLGLKPIITYNYEDDFKAVGSFVTNLSIALKDLQNEKILIVDDTLLHGRAAKHMIEELIICGCKKENISYKVYLRNRDAQIVDESLLSICDCKRRDSTNRWRHVSSKIVDSFMELGWPYMYYLPYYETSLNSYNADKIMDFAEKKNLVDNAVMLQRKHGISSYLYHCKNVFHMSREVLIRIYKYEKADKLVIIPYVYLKPLKCSQIAEAFKFFNSRGVICFRKCENNADFLQYPEMLENNQLKMQYAYSLLTYVCSLLQGFLFLKELGLEDWKRNKTIEKESLECSISFSRDELQNIISGLNKIEMMEDDSYQLEEDENINLVIKLLEEGREPFAEQKEMDVDYFLDHYLKLSSQRDEQLVEEGAKRMRGIEVERICKYISDSADVWRKMHEIIDTGRGSLMPAYIKLNGKKYVDSLLYAGEQNHACNEENLAKIVYPLLQYEAYCKINDISAEKKAEGKSGLIHAIINQDSDLRGKISLQEINELIGESFAQNYKMYYFDKYPMFRDASGVLQGMRLEKNFEHE